MKCERQSFLEARNQWLPLAKQLTSEWLVPDEFGITKLLEQHLELYNDRRQEAQGVIERSHNPNHVPLNGPEFSGLTNDIFNVEGDSKRLNCTEVNHFLYSSITMILLVSRQ